MTLELDCGVTLAPVEFAYETYGDAERRARQRDPGHARFFGRRARGGRRRLVVQHDRSRARPSIPINISSSARMCWADAAAPPGPARSIRKPAAPGRCRFPRSPIADMVRLQKNADRSSGNRRLLAVAGGSMGGMQALEWAVTYPEHVLAAMPIATTARHSAQQIAFNEVGRQAIMADPDWNSGNYYERRPPARGLAVARMVGHITYMSDESMREKFGRRLRSPDEFEVESYLKYRGYKFVDRFDANSYIYITRAMDTFDLTQRGSLPSLFETYRDALSGDQLHFGLAVSQLSIAGNRQRAAQPELRRRLLNLEARYGHDSFLVEVEEQTEMVRGFLASTFREARRWGFSRNLRAQRLRHHRRTDRARHARARSGLRRRRAAGLAQGKQTGGRARRRDGGRERAEGHRARSLGVSGRSGIGARRLSRRRVRLRDP